MNRNNFDILVTGSKGFIGQYIIEKFNKNKINVLSSYNKKKDKI